MSRTIEAIKHHMGPTKSTPAAGAHKKPAARSGTFAIGNDLHVHRLGFRATPLTGPNVWGVAYARAVPQGAVRWRWATTFTFTGWVSARCNSQVRTSGASQPIEHKQLQSCAVLSSWASTLSTRPIPMDRT